VNTTTIVDGKAIGWTATSTLAWLIGGAIGLIAFGFWEANVASHPLVPFRIFKSRTLSTADIVMFLVGGVFFAMWYFLTFYFQSILGYGPVKTGFAFLPMALAIIAGAQISSRILQRTGVRPLLLVGSAMATLGFFWLSMIKVGSSYWGDVFAPSAIAALAMGLLFAPLATAATAGVDRADAGLASGVLNTARQIGGALALAILGTVAADRTSSLLPSMGRDEALVAGYQRVFELSAGIAILALLVSLALPRHTGKHAKS
jgi:Na+/melibiose symporter-like transporter